MINLPALFGFNLAQPPLAHVFSETRPRGGELAVIMRLHETLAAYAYCTCIEIKLNLCDSASLRNNKNRPIRSIIQRLKFLPTGCQSQSQSRGIGDDLSPVLQLQPRSNFSHMVLDSGFADI
jgi:hypothetical protein